MRAREIAAAIGSALAGFALVALAIHPLIPDPQHLYSNMRGEKVALLHAGHGAVSSAAFGSSHVHLGFNPGVFDRVLASATPSLQVHSANLAIFGGGQTEQRLMALDFVRQLIKPSLTGASPAPCLVLLELNARVNFKFSNLPDARVIDLYDWRTVEFSELFSPPTVSLSQRVSRSIFASLAFALHQSNIGMVSTALAPPAIDRQSYAFQTEDDRRGQLLYSAKPTGLDDRNHATPNVPRPPQIAAATFVPGNYELVSEVSRAASVSGVAFVYIVYPNLQDLRQATVYPDQLIVSGRTVPVINLARPDRYPQLYQPELWYDAAHLDAQGAKIASTLLAAELSQWYAAHGTPPACGS